MNITNLMSGLLTTSGWSPLLYSSLSSLRYSMSPLLNFIPKFGPLHEDSILFVRAYITPTTDVLFSLYETKVVVAKGIWVFVSVIPGLLCFFHIPPIIRNGKDKFIKVRGNVHFPKVIYEDDGVFSISSLLDESAYGNYRLQPKQTKCHRERGDPIFGTILYHIVTTPNYWSFWQG
ncbi:unnamed protein product [Vicia faba]|uniref:Uncharacterized protein n=1 Tax=Vicia faba TaxID=3906 RepID=A0AAV0YNM1_VICFA|nr:unnamed protein product [Vicia faba]